MTSGPSIAMELMSNSAVTEWRRLLGPTDSSMARSEAPNSVRAKFGTGQSCTLYAVPIILTDSHRTFYNTPYKYSACSLV